MTSDFSSFAPEEIQVKETENGVVISGSHEGPYSSISVSRTLPLPEGADKTDIVCRYVDGYVIVEVPCAKGQVGTEAATPEPRGREEPACEKKGLECGECGEVQRENRENIAEALEQEFRSLFSSLFDLPVVAIKADIKKKGTDEQTIPVKSKVEKNKDVNEETTAEKSKEAETPAVQDSKSDVEHVEEQATGAVVDETSAADSSNKTEADFQFELDLSGYKPEDVRVVTDENDVIVEAERSVMKDDVIEVEKLSKRFRIPENVNRSQLKSRLSDTGMLTVRAPVVADSEKGGKYIPVKMLDE